MAINSPDSGRRAQIKLRDPYPAGAYSSRIETFWWDDIDREEMHCSCVTRFHPQKSKCDVRFADSLSSNPASQILHTMQAGKGTWLNFIQHVVQTNNFSFDVTRQTHIQVPAQDALQDSSAVS